MNILLLGSGGREHALAWKIAASPLTDRLYLRARQCRHRPRSRMRRARCRRPRRGDRVLPQRTPSTSSWSARKRRSAPALSMIWKRPASRRSARAAAAAQLEGSKGFTKDLCRANGIPTAAYERFRAAAPAKAYLRAHEARRSSSRPTGSPPARASSSRQPSPRPRPPIDMMFGGGLGEAGAERRHRGIPRRRRGVVLRAVRRRRPRSRSAPPRTTSAPSTATTAPTPAAWAPIRRRRSSTAAMSARVMDEIVMPTLARHEGHGRALQGRALCRADDHRRRTQAHRIQCAASAIPNARC